jgi:hypothetical protein
MFVSDSARLHRALQAGAGKPLTFTAPGLVQGGRGRHHDLHSLLPPARCALHGVLAAFDAGELAAMQAPGTAARDEAERLALDARTIDQVAPGEQQPESDHFFKAEGGDAGINKGGTGAMRPAGSATT